MKQLFKFLYVFLLVLGCNSNNSTPNVIFILVDDLGWNDLGYSGSTFYETPNIDNLSKESFQFTNAYAASPVCSPTRAAIMTGKHPARVNITDWIPGDDPQNRPLLGPQDLHELPLKEITIAEKLKESGYNTFYVGKWHLGSQGFYPEDNGFDINIGGFEKGSPMGGYYSPYKNPKLNDGPKGEYLTDRLTDESIKLIKSHNKNEPFALFLSFYNVHTPIQANEKHINYFNKKISEMADNEVRTKSEGDAITRLNHTNPEYASMVYAVDENVGKLIKSLKDSDLYENSLIIFTSDNGGLSTLKRIAPTSVYPLRAGKGWLYEGGIRIPQLIKSPGNTENVIVNDITASYDLFPTILDFAGIKNNIDIDGISLTPILNGQSEIDREDIFWHFPHYHGSLWKPGSAIRSGDWKLVFHYESNNSELFNLKEDPGEINDLSLLFEEKKQILLNKLNNLKNETNANKVSINPNFKN
jgi:arylsulfatase A-like enzyme|tara:strand:- start:6974 stop:8386 length:1413 start_codon:yes stop_codon:yes gene_type:complete